LFGGVYAKMLLHFCAAVKVFDCPRKDAKMLRHFCSSKLIAGFAGGSLRKSATALLRSSQGI